MLHSLAAGGGHDVGDEERDEKGRWSGGGGGSDDKDTLGKGESGEERGGGKGKDAGSGKSSDKVAPAADHTKASVEVFQYLGMVSDLQGSRRRSVEDFIQSEGRSFTPTEESYKGKRGTPHECFKNATEDALKHSDHQYVEGYITVHGVPIQYAWTVDEKGRVFDQTLHPGKEVKGYFGVPFNTKYVLEVASKNKVYGVLGYRSRKTLEPLLAGKVKNFKADLDPAKLGKAVIVERVKFAEAAGKTIASTDKIDTPERHALRARIADALYNEGRDERQSSRQFTYVIGYPASGKTSYTKPAAEATGSLMVNADKAATMLPEFKGGLGAQALHAEAKGIAGVVLERAMKSGDNITIERIDNPDRFVEDVRNLHALGYSVKVVFIDAKPADSEKAVLDRFLVRNRYLPPSLIKSYGDKPRETYEASKLVADSHERYESKPADRAMKDGKQVRSGGSLKRVE